MYTIVDIETTGNAVQGNKITEISIFKFDGNQIVDEFTSLVNPRCEIPYFITRLTGIDDDMVRNAPMLEELAPKIMEITEGAVFVAHSVHFDYNVIKNEFKALGLDFVRKKLCTVRLARRLIPGFHSYSLGKLCSALEIPLTDRHRARGDAHATVLLFQRLLAVKNAEATIKNFLNARSQEATLPSALPKSVFEAIPNKPGIYFFKSSKGEIIYVGKAIDLKKRVLGHFYNKSNKEVQLCRETADIDFELAGSELLALLMESAAIKHYFPKFNRAQKRRDNPYAIFYYEDRNGILHLAFNKLRAAPFATAIFHNLADCRSCLEDLCERFELCPKYCHLQENVAHCSHHNLTCCQGICRGKEPMENYNEKVKAAIGELKRIAGNFVIKERGRLAEEDAVILIENGLYKGYGFIDRKENIGSFEDMTAHIVPQKDTAETQRIIRSYLIKNPDKLNSLTSI